MSASTAALLMVLLFALAGCAGPRPLFPDDVLGWAPGAEESYAPDTLHRYIDGAAEVYLSLGVKGVRAVRYEKPGAPEIIADVFDMGSDARAYGAYHHDVRDGEGAGVGRESTIDGTTLAFWKGRYFVSVIAVGEGSGVAEAVGALGRRIAEAIPDSGSPPRVAALLPERGIVRSRVHYVTSPSLLNRHFFVADDDLFGFAAGVEGVLATYRPAGEEGAYRLLVVEYPRPEGATAALARVRGAYLPGADARGLDELPNGLWSGARASGPVLAVVFDAPSAELANGVLEEVDSLAR